MKRSYVPVTLDAYLNESKTITLKRGYGERQPVVVGATAPLRNQVLSFVAESQRVTKTDLKKFIAGLNEGSKNPIASANMWLQRNAKFFVTESKNGITYFKLSPIGQRLSKRFATSQISESETKNIRRKLNEMTPKSKDFGGEEDEAGQYDFVDRTKGYPRPGLYDEEIEECDKEDKKMDESTKERIKKIIENIKAKRGKKLNEAEEEETEDELTFDDLDLGDEDEKEEGEEKEEEGEELEGEGEEEEAEGEEEETEGEEELEGEGEEKVEITEFVITVDNVEEAIEELSEEGVDAEQVVDEEGEPVENQIKVSADSWEALRGWLEEKGVDIEEMFGGEIEVEDEEGLEGDEIEGDEDLEGGEEAEELEGEDFSLEGGDELEGLEDLGGEGEEEDVEESVEGMEREENQKTPNLVAGRQKQTPMKQTEFSGGKQVTITIK